MTDQEKEIIIQKTASKTLWKEVVDHSDMSIQEEWECPYNRTESFYWIAELTECAPEWKSLKRAVMKVHIALGDFVPISQEDYDNVYSSGDKRRDYPKFEGVRYQWNN